MDRKREFSSVEEVFDALSEEIKAHSLRVEKYADLIFMELLAAEEYTINIHSRVRLRGENRTLIGTAARYHDLGKALVPEFYQWDDPDYTPEEKALYCRHCLAGDELVHGIFRDQKGVVPMTVDIICESIAYHHEHWSGDGFPYQRTEENIPIVGRIVAVANAMDHLLMTTKTETPVNTVIDMMMEDSGSIYDPVIMGLLYEAKHKVERVFAAYRSESKAIPQAPRVIKRKKRPMWLEYRPISDLAEKKAAAVEADMKFKRGKDTVEFAEAEHLLRESKLLADAGTCFLLEALDTARRMNTCGVGGKFVALNLVPAYFKKRGVATAIIKMISDTDSTPESIGFILKDKEATPTVTLSENCQKLSAAGCKIIVSDVPMENVELENLKALGTTHLRLLPSDIENIGDHMPKLEAAVAEGIEIIGGGVDKHRLINILEENGICLASGDIIGEYIPEDDFIQGELALIQE